MGQSTNGIICYGVDFGEDLPWSWKKMGEAGFECGDVDEYMAFILGGLHHPKKEYSEETKEIHERYWDQKTKVLKGSGVKLVRHCSDECPMYILAVAETVETARRGYPVKILRGNTLNFEASKKLRDALRKFGHEDTEPEWLLCSMWG